MPPQASEPPPGASPAGVGALLAAYASGGASARAVVLESAARARASSGGEWISVADDARLEEAVSALRGCAPDSRALYGVPFGVKDNIDVAGMRTTAACERFAYVAERSAACVRRLEEAGAVCIGKTNLDQFATGLVGTRSPFGVVANCVDEKYISGGSSSGSGVVVAKGVVAFALGTDTAGSGRVPAGFNNVVGMKPTPGRVSTHGVVPACRTLDCVSVFALSASDAARVLAVVEDMDGQAREPAFHPCPSPRGPSLFSGMRMGVPKEMVAEMSPEYLKAFGDAKGAMKNVMGASVIDVDFDPLHEVAAMLYDGPWVAERHTVIAPLLERDPSAVEPVVSGIVSGATRFSASDGFQAWYRLAALRMEVAQIWQAVDFLMVPTAPNHPTIAQVMDAPVRCNSALGGYTNFVNLLGWSALAMPASMIAETGLPFGITLIAPAGHDVALLTLGAKWQATATKQLPWGEPRADMKGVHTDLPAQMPQSEKLLELAVVGAHLTGMPLHYQMVERNARLLKTCKTAPCYRLYALAGTVPRKPGLVRAGKGEQGHSIELEVYAMPAAAVGSFLEMIPSPLGLGTVELDDGGQVKSFICEPCGIEGATEVSDFGGWRNYIASLKSTGGV